MLGDLGQMSRSVVRDTRGRWGEGHTASVTLSSVLAGTTLCLCHPDDDIPSCTEEVAEEDKCPVGEGTPPLSWRPPNLDRRGLAPSSCLLLSHCLKSSFKMTSGRIWKSLCRMDFGVEKGTMIKYHVICQRQALGGDYGSGILGGY